MAQKEPEKIMPSTMAKAMRHSVNDDNFRMNTGYGRYGAAYNMVGLRCLF
jgi:hypothetical protein